MYMYVILFLNIRQVVIQYLLAGPVMNSSDTAGIIRRKEKQFPVRILCQSESERQRDRESPLPPRRWKKKGERALDTLCHWLSLSTQPARMYFLSVWVVWLLFFSVSSKDIVKCWICDTQSRLDWDDKTATTHTGQTSCPWHSESWRWSIYSITGGFGSLKSPPIFSFSKSKAVLAI